MAANSYTPRITEVTKFTIQAFSPQEKDGFKETEIELPPGLTPRELIDLRMSIQDKENQKFENYKKDIAGQRKQAVDEAAKKFEIEDKQFRQQLELGKVTKEDEKDLREARHKLWQEQRDLLATSITYFASKRKESAENESTRKQLAVNRAVYWPIQQRLNDLLENFEQHITKPPKIKQKASGGLFGIGKREETYEAEELDDFMNVLDRYFKLGTEPTSQAQEKATEAEKAAAKFGLDQEAQSAYTGLRAHIAMNIITPLIQLRTDWQNASKANNMEALDQLKNRALQLRTNIAQQINGLAANMKNVDEQANLNEQDKKILGMIDDLAKSTMSNIPDSKSEKRSRLKTVNDMYQQMDDAFTAMSEKKIEPLTDVPGESYITGYMQVAGKPIRFLTGTKSEKTPSDFFQWTPELKKQYKESETGKYFAKTAPSEKDIAKFLAQASAGLYGNDIAEYLPSLYHGWIISRFKTNPEPIRQYIEKMDMKDALGYGSVKKEKPKGVSSLPGYYLNDEYHPTPMPSPNEVVDTPGALSAISKLISTSSPVPTSSSPIPTARTRTFGESVPLEYQNIILGKLNKKN